MAFHRLYWIVPVGFLRPIHMLLSRDKSSPHGSLRHPDNQVRLAMPALGCRAMNSYRLLVRPVGLGHLMKSSIEPLVQGRKRLPSLWSNRGEAMVPEERDIEAGD